MLDKAQALIEFLKTGGDIPVTMESYSAAIGLVDAAAAEIATVRSLPTIICLCGSTRFPEHFQRANTQATMKGMIVLGPGVWVHGGHEVNDAEKSLLDALHFRKIDLADQVYVINVDGYIGDSTHKEIVYASRTGKLVQFLEPQVLTKRGDRITSLHYLMSIEQTLKMEVSQ